MSLGMTGKGAAGGRRRLVVIVVAAAVVVVAVAAAALLRPRGTTAAGSPSVEAGARTTTTVATWTYDGKSHDVSIQDVLDYTGAEGSYASDDGLTYDVPSAETTLALVRTEALAQAAEDEGIDVSDDDVDAYVTDTMGYDSVDDAADEYGMDADTLREQVRRGLMVQRLQDSKVDSSALDDATVPDPPTAPDDGDVSTASAEYRDYILDLVGDAYDASTGTWADPEGTYALALSQYDLSGGTATYEAAEAAYAAALSLSQDAYSTSDDAWTDYVNGVLSRVTVTLAGAEE